MAPRVILHAVVKYHRTLSIIAIQQGYRKMDLQYFQALFRAYFAV